MIFSAADSVHSCTALRLNDRDTDDGQRPACAAARASNPSLICSTTLIFSVIGMNSEGAIQPSSEWCQRASASKLVTSMVCRSMIG